jgi:hypothetical protein
MRKPWCSTLAAATLVLPVLATAQAKTMLEPGKPTPF